MNNLLFKAENISILNIWKVRFPILNRLLLNVYLGLNWTVQPLKHNKTNFNNFENVVSPTVQLAPNYTTLSRAKRIGVCSIN